MAESVLSEKSLAFALSIVETYKVLCRNGECIMSKQMLRSGTSIGANVAEASMAQTLPDFSSKMYIALKEANETIYWLKLIGRAGYLNQMEAEKLKEECRELLRMLIATTKKTAPRQQ